MLMPNKVGIKIEAKIAPVSINKAFKNIPGKGRIKTGDYKRFKTDLEEILNTKENKDMRDWFLEIWKAKDCKKILTVLIVNTPKELYYTVKGDISNRKGDVANYRKCAQDIIFNWMGIDDKYSVMGLDIQVPVNSTYSFSFQLTCIDTEDLDMVL